jgi:iron complex transport system ATP-binding protein
MTNPLVARNIHFSYNENEPLLRGVDLELHQGEVCMIIGANGSGKTTLLRLLLGRRKPQQGEIFVDQRPLVDYSPKELANHLAYVPQKPVAAFEYTVEQIILMGRFAKTGPLSILSDIDRNVAKRAMEATDSWRLRSRSLDELSGGEAQRVMTARALAQEPTVMLLDEPTSFLDIKHQLGIHHLLKRLTRENAMAVCCVSHDVNLAARFADRMIAMADGRIVAAGSPRDVIRKDVLRETYGVEIDLIEAPGLDVPLVIAK